MNLQIKTFDQYEQAYARSVADPEGFWSEVASQFVWQKPWRKALKWNFREPDIQWFPGGKLNITENCLDRHLAERGSQTALIWEPNDPGEPSRKFTYKQLHKEVCRLANVLKANGIRKGDRVCIYMPLVPELTFAVLACARLGAIHSVVFGGFSAISLADRIKDATAKMVLCSDGAFRGDKKIAIKAVVDEALDMGCESVETVLVLKRTGQEVSMREAKDKWWHEELAGKRSACKPAGMDAEDRLFILYTSGSTGKPKGVVHTCGGYMVFTWYTFINVFQYQPGEVFWCTADIGWITGHSYIVYGPLLAGATTMMFEGIPTYPDPSRFWAVCKRHKVNIFYTAPTAIRALMAAGDSWAKKYKLNSLRVLGTVGEPINAEAWHWYDEKIGRNRCPIVDTWWQTETGGILISALAGITPLKPTFAGLPLPGVQLLLVDSAGNEITENGVEGLLCIKFPWPSILRTIWGDHERCRQTYFGTFKNLYFTGDGARRDEDGFYRIIGRVDDVINVSGHRIGTAEVENAINQHPNVVESAVVGYPHDIKGQGIYAYVITLDVVLDAPGFHKEIHAVVTREIGPIAKPDMVQIVPGLPKTRSGKIMRRILRKIAEGDTSNLGDVTTLLNPEVVEEIKKGALG